MFSCEYKGKKTTKRRTVAVRKAPYNKRTSLDLPADVSRLSEVSGPSDNDEQGVFVEAEVEVCGRSAPRLRLDLPLRYPAGRHVGKLAVGCDVIEKA